MGTIAPIRKPSRMPFLTQPFTRQPLGEAVSGSAARMLPSFSPSLNCWNSRRCLSLYRSGGLSKSDSICSGNMPLSHEAKTLEHAADFLLVVRPRRTQRKPAYQLEHRHLSLGRAQSTAPLVVGRGARG